MAKKNGRKDLDERGSDYGASHGPTPGLSGGNEFNDGEVTPQKGRGMYVVASGLIDTPQPGGDNEMDAALKRELGGRKGR